MLNIHSDDYFMQKALQEARLAYEEGEVPVGAVITDGTRILAKAHNQTERLTDVTAHAEILALTAASDALGSKYLPDCTLYVTLEPCIMCAGALAWSQIGRVVFGAEDHKRGFMRYGKGLLHPKTQVSAGLMQETCAALLQEFFKAKR